MTRSGWGRTLRRILRIPSPESRVPKQRSPPGNKSKLDGTCRGAFEAATAAGSLVERSLCRPVRAAIRWIDTKDEPEHCQERNVHLLWMCMRRHGTPCRG